MNSIEMLTRSVRMRIVRFSLRFFLTSVLSTIGLSPSREIVVKSTSFSCFSYLSFSSGIRVNSTVSGFAILYF
jgi:hypothetical protein